MKARYVLLPLLVIALFLPMVIGFFQDTSFDDGGELVNAIFLLLTVVGIPLVMLVAALKGKFRPAHEQFFEQGYIDNPTLSRSKPDLLPTLLFIGMMILIGAMAIYGVAAFIAARDDYGGLPWWTLLGLFPLFLYLYVFAYLVARFVVNRRIARLMAGASFAKPPVDVSGHRPLVEPPGRCELITELPERPRRWAGRGSGARPLRVLYLWNFDVGYPQLEIRTWRRFGPVYWLWSPNNVPASQYMKLAFGREVSTFFADTEQQVQNWLHESDETPRTTLFGGRRYPAHAIACMEDRWKAAVSEGCRHADAVVLDARGFTRERSGLAWEISHLVSHVPVEKFLVLADIATDLRFLVETVHAVAQPDAPVPLARIVYPPLIRSREELEALFKKDRLPTLKYGAPQLLGLLATPEERIS